MNLLKNKKDILIWLKKYDITKYELIIDKDYGFIVNVNGDVNLDAKNLKNISVKFNEVIGDFICHSNFLTSLSGAPKVVHKSFDCGRNALTSLEFCPEYVGLNFCCDLNDIKTLVFCPKYVGGSPIGDFICHGNFPLGDFQHIDDFKKIYEEHRRQVILKNAEELENKIEILKSKKLINIENNDNKKKPKV